MLHWTGGHPYLTQRLCQAVAENEAAARATTSADVDRACHALFLAPGARERDDNLLFVRERLLHSADADIAGLLELYGQVRAGCRRVPDDETNPLASVLRLSGVARSDGGGLLRVRNPIYARVFDRAWIAANLPDAERRRQKAAYRRGVLRTAGVSLAIFAAMGALAWWAVRSAEWARAQSRRAERAASEARQERTNAVRAAGEARQQTRRADKNADDARANAERARQQQNAAREAEVRARRLADERQAALDDALAQKRRADRNARRAEDEAGRASAEAQRRRKLGEAYLAEARARRWSGQPGRRFDSLAALERAAALLGPSLELRNEAIAALALEADLRLDRRLVGGGIPQGTEVAASDLAHGRYARIEDARGTVSARSLADAAARELVRLPGPGDWWECARFSPNGRFLAIRHWTGGNSVVGRVRVWDVARRSVVFEAANAAHRAIAFRPDSGAIAYGTSDGQAHVYDLAAARKPEQVFDLGQQFGPPYTLCFRPDGRALACGSLQSRELLLCDLTTGDVSRSPCPGSLFAIAWHPEGRLVALACRGRSIIIRDMATGRTEELKGHQSQPTTLAFNRHGDLLASLGWDGVLRLWNPHTGRLLVSAPIVGDLLDWGADDRLLAAGRAILTTWKVAASAQARALCGLPASVTICGLDFSADARLMLSASEDGGARVWDVGAEREAGLLLGGFSRTALFHPDGKSLWTSGASGVQRWPLAWERGGGTMRIGPPAAALGSLTEAWSADLSRDGRTLAVLQAGSAHVLDTRTGTRRARLPDQWREGYLAVSPDGRWVAANNVAGGQINVWDARTGRRVRDLPAGLPVRQGIGGAAADLAFSPDGRWLVTGDRREYRFWEVGSWRPGRRIPRPGSINLAGHSAFSPDGTLLAVVDSPFTVCLLDAPTGRRLATLESPDPHLIHCLRFSPDSSLLAVGWDGHNATQVWNLRSIRQNLARLGLDWNLAPYPPQPPHPPSRKPLIVQVVPATPPQ